MLPLVLAICLASPSEVDTLREQVRQLKALNESLSAEITRLKGEPGKTLAEQRQADDLRRLDELARRLKEDKPGAGIKQEAALAERLALAVPGSVRWEVLVAVGVLRDGLTVEEAQKLVGPSTGSGKGYVDWYHNERNAQVAPYLRATIKDGKLVDWTTGRR